MSNYVDHGEDERRGLWACDDCGFAFAKEHTSDDDGGHECQVCAETALRKTLARVRVVIETPCAAIVDTIWESDTCTLVDYIDSVLYPPPVAPAEAHDPLRDVHRRYDREDGIAYPDPPPGGTEAPRE